MNDNTPAINCSGVDPDIFFDDERIEQAKAICDGCPFARECAILGATEDYGVWGGLESEPITDQDATIVSLHADGLTLSDIADVTGASRETVRGVIDRRKPAVRLTRTEATIATRDRNARIVRLRSAGGLVRDIAVDVGLSESRVKRILSGAAA